MTDDTFSGEGGGTPPGDEATNEWELTAGAWERTRDRVFDGFRTTSNWLIDQIDPGPGQTILELAAGPGETGFLAAERIGPTGRLISTDLAPSMVDAARRGAEARGLGNVECRVMDAQQIDLPDSSVDAVISRLGLMLVPDPEAAFAEIRRVLRPSGRVAYAVMGTPDRNQWMSLMVGTLMQHGHHPAGANPFALGGVFGLSASQRNEELLRAAGFANVRAEELPGTMHFASPEDYWDFQSSLAGPVRRVVSSLGADEVAAINSTLEEMMSPFDAEGSYDLPTCLVVVAAS